MQSFFLHESTTFRYDLFRIYTLLICLQIIRFFFKSTADFINWQMLLREFWPVPSRCIGELPSSITCPLHQPSVSPLLALSSVFLIANKLYGGSRNFHRWLVVWWLDYLLPSKASLIDVESERIFKQLDLIRLTSVCTWFSKEK